MDQPKATKQKAKNGKQKQSTTSRKWTKKKRPNQHPGKDQQGVK
jgi:hypothetical protein